MVLVRRMALGHGRFAQEVGEDMEDTDFLALAFLAQSVVLGLMWYQLQLLTKTFRELIEQIDKWDEAMQARTWIFKQVKSNEQQRGNA